MTKRTKANKPPRTRKELEADLDALNQLFDLQHKRTVFADKLWREAHPGSEHILPDLGTLIDWLVRCAQSEKERADKLQERLIRLRTESKRSN